MDAQAAGAWQQNAVTSQVGAAVCAVVAHPSLVSRDGLLAVLALMPAAASKRKMAQCCMVSGRSWILPRL